MKIPNKLASTLHLTEEEKAYISSIDTKRYCKLNLIVTVLIILATIFLPVIYLYLISGLHYVNSEARAISQSANFALYKSIWVSHAIALFLFIPSFSLVIFYAVIRKHKDFQSFAILKSLIIYSVNLKKLFADQSTLDEKISLLDKKFLKISLRMLVISIFLFVNLLLFDTSNYTIITDELIVSKKYATITEKRMLWKDLERTSSGCGYTATSYMNPFTTMKWQYNLLFDNRLVFDLESFSSIKGSKVYNIGVVDAIARALEVKNVNQSYDEGIFEPKVLNEKCREFLAHNYSQKDHDILVNVLNLK